ncbi:MAG: fibronectin type III domain-containing protein [Lachnospiraceae bacterium]|nr:fibronectin type III domain-containing protein [Lachnospiraceae bacterium]
MFQKKVRGFNNRQMIRRRRIGGRIVAGAMAFGMSFGSLAGAMPFSVPMLVLAEDEKTVIEFNASTLPDGDIKSTMVVGDFTLIANATYAYTVDANSKQSADGSLTFTKRLKSNGATTDNNRTINFFAPGPGTLELYMLSANSSETGRKLGLYNDSMVLVGGQEYKAPGSAAEGGVLEPFTFEVEEAGSYQFRVDAGINVYYIKGEFTGKAEAPAQRAAWDTVEKPTIENVEINENGTIDVEVSAELGLDGADYVRVFAMQDGFEVTSALYEGETVTLAPNFEGDYQIVPVAYRSGCEDKTGLFKVVKEYKLPLAAPEIRWIDNRGNGTVYIDWLDLDVDRFELAYGPAGGEMQTVTDLEDTAGDYTLTGLEEGQEYTVSVKAYADDRSSEYSKNFTVGEAEQQWYVACFGSATSGVATVNGQEIEIKSAAEATPAEDVTNGNGSVAFASAQNGKVADSEDGFFYYYTKIDPNTENFKISATFTVTDVTDGPDNQTGYGIYATDMEGLGSKDTKYFNSVAVGQYKMKGGGYHSHGARLVSGYTTADTTNVAGDERNLRSNDLFSVVNKEDTVNVGDSFTYTLEKTDTRYIARMEGTDGEIAFDGTDVLMKMDDGSVCVGVMSARKVGVEITDISFEKSAGQVLGESVTLIDPMVKFYNSETAGSEQIELIAAANVEGKLSITAADGSVVGDAQIDLEEGKFVKLPVTLTEGANAYHYSFTPDAGRKDLAATETINGDVQIVFHRLGNEGESMYVAPDGTAQGLGTKESPLDLQSALDYAQPGQVIVMMDGIYEPEKDYVIGRNVNGREDAMITLMAENTGKAVISGSKDHGSSSLLSIVGSYWHVFGLEVKDGSAKGISVCGNHNIVEMCVIHNVGNSGLQISRYSGEYNDAEMWPSDNLIKNCEAYDCCDEARNDADGFAAKLTCGEGNTFLGCISHHNIDDGWDLYAKSTTGSIGAVKIENCIAYSNGFLTTDDPTDPNVEFGEGNGFKLGGENMYGGHILLNCVSFNNYAKGITSNSCPDCSISYCTAYNNSLNGSAYNVSLYTRTSNKKAWTVNGMLSFADNGTTTAELGSSNGILYSLRSEDNYFFDGAASYNNKGIKASAAWFENTDVTVLPSRNADGSIDMHGLLVPTSDCPANAAARIVVAGPKAISEQPAITTVVSITPLPQESVAEVPANGGLAADEPAGGNGGAIALGICGAVAAAAVVLTRRKKDKKD